MLRDILLVYLLLINAAGFAIMCLDKRYAKKKMRRVPESTLLWVAALGGSAGSLAGMYLARHKTRHIKFTVTVPILLVLHLALLIWVYPRLS